MSKDKSIARVLNWILAVVFLIAGYLIFAGILKPNLKAAEFIGCIALSGVLELRATRARE